MKTRRTFFQTRKQAGAVLAQMLRAKFSTRAVVVGVNKQGMSVASEISKQLDIELEYMPCHAITHPSKAHLPIGSICEAEVFLHDFPCGDTDELLLHVQRFKELVDSEFIECLPENFSFDFAYKTVFLCTDVITSADEIVASIHSIKRQSPLQVILAVAVISSDALKTLACEVDEVVYVNVAGQHFRAEHYISSLPQISNRRIKKMLMRSTDIHRNQ